MSAERRLNVDASYEDNDTIEVVKEKMKKIIDIAVAGDALQNLRQEPGNFEIFETLVSFCLINFTTSFNWRYNAYSVGISEIFTPSDEALCILLLENNAADYIKMHDEQRKINRKESKPKWTKVESSDKKFKGWDRRGIRRFNVIVKAITTNRQLTASQNMEQKLKMKYARLSQNEIDGEDGSQTYNEDLDDLNGYDGFGGDIELDTAINQCNDVPTELEGIPVTSA